jgi:hypothetical protein
MLTQAPRDVADVPRRSWPEQPPLLEGELLHPCDDFWRKSHVRGKIATVSRSRFGRTVPTRLDVEHLPLALGPRHEFAHCEVRRTLPA